MNLADQYMVDITGIGLIEHEISIHRYYREHGLITHVIGTHVHDSITYFADTSTIQCINGDVWAFPPKRNIDFSILLKRTGG